MLSLISIRVVLICCCLPFQHPRCRWRWQSASSSHRVYCLLHSKNVSSLRLLRRRYCRQFTMPSTVYQVGMLHYKYWSCICIMHFCCLECLPVFVSYNQLLGVRLRFTSNWNKLKGMLKNKLQVSPQLSLIIFYHLLWALAGQVFC